MGETQYTDGETNYCHDPQIKRAAQSLGIQDKNIINRALSIGEVHILLKMLQKII